ncbi:TPA: DUF5611 family protein [Methanosarcinaceae archaeon]|nr:DUF5611 family protein [Methanosarcinaceae archaeon]
MQQYKLKRGFKPEIERIYSVMQECFPGEIVREGDVLETAYGAMSKITVSIENKKMVVDTASNPSMMDDETILQTNRYFRDFLYKATGYTAKERLKQAKKKSVANKPPDVNKLFYNFRHLKAPSLRYLL